MNANITFTSALVFTDELVVMTAAGDSLDAYANFTRIMQWADEPPPKWWSHDVDWRAVSIAYFGPEHEDLDDFVVLSDEGHVHYVGDHKPLTEKIPCAGLHSPGAMGWGYMSALKQIGDHLYACGGAGQVYQRRGANDWIPVDHGILQAPDVSERLLPRAIDGPHEEAIYLVGSFSATGHPPFVYYWDGQTWQTIELPEVAERITNIYVESESRIWLCGANGTLLLGNAFDGFRSLSSVTDNQLFLSLCLFQNKIYLGSSLGLFCYDPNNHAKGICAVVTGLIPELQDTNIVDSVEGVLWSIGPKDIARFDGSAWERIHHPDNPPIGAKVKNKKP